MVWLPWWRRRRYVCCGLVLATNTQMICVDLPFVEIVSTTSLLHRSLCARSRVLHEEVGQRIGAAAATLLCKDVKLTALSWELSRAKKVTGNRYINGSSTQFGSSSMLNWPSELLKKQSYQKIRIMSFFLQLYLYLFLFHFSFVLDSFTWIQLPCPRRTRLMWEWAMRYFKALLNRSLANAVN